MAAAGSTWSTEEWTAAVLAAKPRVAVFDCDGTLWEKDSGFEFMRWSLEQGLVSRHASEWLSARYREYRAGTVDEATICGEMVQVYAGLREAELQQAAAQFFASVVEPTIFPAMQQLVSALQQDGCEIWAVSSTADWVVEAGVGERFSIGAERVLAARVKAVDGVATGTLLAVPTDEAKAVALRAAGIAEPDAVFGNSVHDLAMLEMARRAYPVNPSEALLAEAEQRGWPVFRPDRALAAARR
ncbi:HAD family phosphatase [Acidipila sp. EB88]|uniref:HAD family hydrolase n=1 Tax=Acidipila sp. EB88 TaxID=2305226 RepID=UPI000F5DBE59|nr:HAD-IB family phosphatase [Acidipila sp. EB88]RRA49205.1 haloacid dehalogenase-like hydrolase [Acidipila sp. EB88]